MAQQQGEGPRALDARIPVERTDSSLEGLLDGHDAVEASGVQQAEQRGTVAVHDDPALVLTDAADPADESTETGGVHEGHAAEIDHQAPRVGVFGKCLAELGHGVGVELAGRTEQTVRPCLVVERLDVQHGHRGYTAAADIWGSQRAGTISAVPDLLLVTDADWIAQQCEAALGGGHRLHRVRRGADTLEAIELVEPDLVLLDLQVGNMGGMAACLAVRQEEGMGRLEPRPVIMLLDRDADEFLARRSEADAWLVKPINPMRLARLVESTLAEASAPA